MPKKSAFSASAPAHEASNAEKIGIQSICAGVRGLQCRKNQHSERPR